MRISDWSSDVCSSDLLTDPERRSTKHMQFGDITLRLGSIHSVKGKTVDGILVVESEVWKGSRADEQCIDLTTVLPRAFGVTAQPFAGEIGRASCRARVCQYV